MKLTCSRLPAALSAAVRSVVVIAAASLFLACTTISEDQRKEEHLAFLESRPRSILVLPPINKSMDVKGSLIFLSTSTIPLAESGYYVIPVTLSEQTFRQNGVTVAEDAHAISYQRLYEVFGADAALYITISNFSTNFGIVNSASVVEASAELIDLRSGQRLWSGREYLREDSGVNNIGAIASSSNLSEFLFSLLYSVADAAINQVSDTLSNKTHTMGKMANYNMLSADNSSSILYGPYHPRYGTD